MTDPKELWLSLERLGEDEVRRRRAANVYGERKRGLVDAWLDEQERARERQVTLSQTEQEAQTIELSNEANRLAREANAIAFDANREAARSNRIARWTLGVSLLGLVVATGISVRACQSASASFALTQAEFRAARQAIWSGSVDAQGEAIVISSADPQIRLQRASVEFPKALRQPPIVVEPPRFDIPLLPLRTNLQEIVERQVEVREGYVRLPAESLLVPAVLDAHYVTHGEQFRNRGMYYVVFTYTIGPHVGAPAGVEFKGLIFDRILTPDENAADILAAQWRQAAGG